MRSSSSNNRRNPQPTVVDLTQTITGQTPVETTKGEDVGVPVVEVSLVARQAAVVRMAREGPEMDVRTTTTDDDPAVLAGGGRETLAAAQAVQEEEVHHPHPPRVTAMTVDDGPVDAPS